MTEDKYFVEYQGKQVEVDDIFYGSVLMTNTVISQFKYSCIYTLSQFNFFINKKESKLWERFESKSSNKSFFNEELIKEYVTVPKEGDSLYIDDSCTLPKNSLGRNFKKVRNPDKADIIVFGTPQGFSTTSQTFVFKNKDIDEVFFVIGTGDLLAPNIGESFFEWIDRGNNPFIKRDKQRYFSKDYEKLSNSYCENIGTIICFNKNQLFIKGIIEGKYSSIYYDHFLNHDTVTAEQSFNLDTMNLFIEQLRSRDNDVALMTLKTLASMNYYDYPTVVKYILIKSNASNIPKSKLPSNIKAMFKYLDTILFYRLYENVQPKEKEICKQIIEKEWMDQIKDMLIQRKKSTNLEFSYDFKLIWN